MQLGPALLVTAGPTLQSLPLPVPARLICQDASTSCAAAAEQPRGPCLVSAGATFLQGLC